MSELPTNLRGLAVAMRVTAQAGNPIQPKHALELAATLDEVATSVENDEKVIAAHEAHAARLEELLAIYAPQTDPAALSAAAE